MEQRRPPGECGDRRVLATNFFEPVAGFLEGILPSLKYYWDFPAIWGLFALFVVVLETAAKQASQVKVRFLPDRRSVGRLGLLGRSSAGSGVLHADDAAYRAVGPELPLRQLPAARTDALRHRPRSPMDLLHAGRCRWARWPVVPAPKSKPTAPTSSTRITLHLSLRTAADRRGKREDGRAAMGVGDFRGNSRPGMCPRHAPRPMGISSPSWESSHDELSGYQSLCGLLRNQPDLRRSFAAGADRARRRDRAGRRDRRRSGGTGPHRPQCPSLAGRRLALWGVSLSLLFFAAAPAEWLGYRWQIRREAIGVGDAWFAMLRDNQPQMAFQLTQEPAAAPPSATTRWRNSTATRPSCATLWPPTCGSRRCGHCWRWATARNRAATGSKSRSGCSTAIAFARSTR